MLKKIKNYLLNTKLVLAVFSFAKKIVLPGFEKMPLYDVMVFFIKGIRKGSIETRASSLAFFFFLAIFPSIIFLFTLIPYIPIKDFQDQLMDVIKNFMPHSVYEATEDTLSEIIKRQNGGLLSIGFISALYFSTNGFNAMINVFNQTSHSLETRTPFMTRMISILLVLILSTLLVVAIALLVFSEIVLNYFHFLGSFEAYLIIAGRWVIIFALFFCIISFIYYLGPASKLGWKFVTAGSTLATILSLLTSWGFAFYVNNFGQYNKIYGSIGTLIVMLMWIYFNSYILLLGFELNASIHNAKSVGKNN